MPYAYIRNGQVDHISDSPNEELSAANAVIHFECECAIGDTFDGEKFTPPVIDLVPPTVDRVCFKMLWSSAERVAIKKLRTTDATIADFWELLEDPQTTIVRMHLMSVRGAIEYTLMALKVSGLDIDVSIRKADILSGVLK